MRKRIAAFRAAHLHCVCDLLHHARCHIVAQACIVLDQHVAVVHLALRLAGHIHLQQRGKMQDKMPGEQSCFSAAAEVLRVLGRKLQPASHMMRVP